MAGRAGDGELAFRSKIWPAALWVILDRDGGEFTHTRRLGLTRFQQQVRREITRRGGQKPCLRIVPQATAISSAAL